MWDAFRCPVYQCKILLVFKLTDPSALNLNHPVAYFRKRNSVRYTLNKTLFQLDIIDFKLYKSRSHDFWFNFVVSEGRLLKPITPLELSSLLRGCNAIYYFTQKNLKKLVYVTKILNLLIYVVASPLAGLPNSVQFSYMFYVMYDFLGNLNLGILPLATLAQCAILN